MRCSRRGGRAKRRSLAEWTRAAAGAGLLATWGLVRADVPAWLMPLVVLGATVSSLYRAVLRER